MFQIEHKLSESFDLIGIAYLSPKTRNSVKHNRTPKPVFML